MKRTYISLATTILLVTGWLYKRDISWQRQR